MELARYEEVPGHVAQQVVQEAEREQEAVKACRPEAAPMHRGGEEGA